MENTSRGNSMTRSRFPDGFRIMQGKHEFVTYIEHSSVRIWYSDVPWFFDSHYHSAVEIIVPIKGEVIYQVEGVEYAVQTGEVLIVPPNRVHNLRMEAGSERYLLLFEPDGIFGLRDMPLIDNLLRNILYLDKQPELQETVRSLLLKCVECYENREFLWNSICYSYLTQMYVRLGQCYAAHITPQRQEVRTMDPEIVDSARLFIDQNFARELTLDDVSSFTGFSKYYFSRIFKQQLGVSFSEYLRQKRVSVAVELLIHSRQSIQEIAKSAGFGSISTFNRIFREAKNCSPGEFRRMYGDM